MRQVNEFWMTVFLLVSFLNQMKKLERKLIQINKTKYQITAAVKHQVLFSD
jgi:hypothetical protein